MKFLPKVRKKIPIIGVLIALLALIFGIKLIRDNIKRRPKKEKQEHINNKKQGGILFGSHKKGIILSLCVVLFVTFVSASVSTSATSGDGNIPNNPDTIAATLQTFRDFDEEKSKPEQSIINETVQEQAAVTSIPKQIIDKLVQIESDNPHNEWYFVSAEEEETPVNKFNIYTTQVSLDSSSTAHEKRVAAEELAEEYIGRLDYVWGGSSLTDGCDCSGFVYAIYEACGLGDLVGKRSACRDMVKMAEEGTYQFILDISEADLGDIIVYRNSEEYILAHPKESEWGHCAIYAGNNRVVHCKDEHSGCVKTRLQFRAAESEYVIIRILQ